MYKKNEFVTKQITHTQHFENVHENEKKKYSCLFAHFSFLIRSCMRSRPYIHLYDNSAGLFAFVEMIKRLDVWRNIIISVHFVPIERSLISLHFQLISFPVHMMIVISAAH